MVSEVREHIRLPPSANAALAGYRVINEGGRIQDRRYKPIVAARQPPSTVNLGRVRRYEQIQANRFPLPEPMEWDEL